jgi:hypothetical protein
VNDEMTACPCIVSGRLTCAVDSWTSLITSEEIIVRVSQHVRRAATGIELVTF